MKLQVFASTIALTAALQCGIAQAQTPPRPQPLPSGDDLLEPLVRPTNDDLLEPLERPSNDDLLEPLERPSNDDLLEPLERPSNDDLLEPLERPSNDDLLEPLERPSNDDLLEPLVDDLSAAEKAQVDQFIDFMTPEGDTEFAQALRQAHERIQRQRREQALQQDRLRRDMEDWANSYEEIDLKDDEVDQDGERMRLVERTRVDPCGTFTVSWGGRKTCTPRTIRTWEMVPVDTPPPPTEPEEKDEDAAPPPGPRGSPPPANGPASGGATGGASSGGGGAPSAGGAPGPAGGPGPSGAPGAGGAGSGNGGIVGPHVAASAGQPTDEQGRARAYLPLKTFSARLDRVVMTEQGLLDITVSLTNITRRSQLVANGDWTVIAADEDGLTSSDRAIWRATSGAAVNFETMPMVGPGEGAQIRFLVRPEAARAGITEIALLQNSGPPAVFDVTNVAGLARAAGEARASGDGPFLRLRNVEARVDSISTSGGRQEVILTVRNPTEQIQYAGGTRLTLTGVSATGQPTTAHGETYAVRGTRSEPTGIVPLRPGGAVRLRYLFDRPSSGGLSVREGGVTQNLPAPAAARAPEPVW